MKEENSAKKLSVWDFIPKDIFYWYMSLGFLYGIIDLVKLPKTYEQPDFGNDLPDRETEGFMERINSFHSESDNFSHQKRKNNYADVVRGWRNIGGKRFYFKSLWEINFSKYLQYQKENGVIVDWEYEPTTFWFKNVQRGVRSYKPDFRVMEDDGTVLYYEIKGWMNRQSKTKLKRMKKYYPDVRIKVINEKWFATNGKSLSVIIKGWEKKESKKSFME